MAYKEFLDETLSTVQEEDLQIVIPYFFEDRKKEIIKKEENQDLVFIDKNYNLGANYKDLITTNVKALSFFSGCGGFDIGTHLAGVEVISAMDFDASCVRTLNSNKIFENAFISHENINNVKGGTYDKVIKDNKAEKLIIIGGPPCQPFSKAGYWKGNDARLGFDDPRNMIGEYLRIINDIRPDGFILENVESILHPSNKIAVEFIIENINQLGYDYRVVKANAIDYGVPQKRKRLFFVASKNKFKTNEPQKTHGINGNMSFESVINWIGKFDIPKYAENAESAEGKYFEDLIQVPNGKNYIALTARNNYVNPKFVAGKRYWTFLLKLEPALPSWTIIAQPGHWEGPFHWTNRRLRVPEIAAIQTFPEDFVLYGSPRVAHKQIGNAVPPLLGKAIVKFLIENL